MIPDQAINQTVAQIIPDNNMVVIYKAPEKEGLEQPTTADFQNAIDVVKVSEIKPNEAESIESNFLDPATLKGSAIKSESEGIYGSTVWTLKNGLTVVLRPSTEEKDKVVFDLYKNGGKSLIPTGDLNSFESNVWGAFQGFCGISKFPGTTVTKMLSGKNVGVEPYLNALRHGVRGSSTPKDLETALQLAYLYFADPRFDQAEFDKAINQLRAVLPNFVLQPSYKFTKELQKTLYGDNPRNIVISEETLDKANLGTIEKNYRMLFKDAAGATINICGDFDIETIKPLVEKYLGSIKKGKKPLNWVDNDKNMLPGKVTNDFKVDMQTPKVTVIEVFDAKLKEYRLLDDVALSAATYILDMRYTKSLREDEGGTYGASTHGEISILPKPEATLQVYFDTKPVAADKLVELSIEGLNSLAKDGPTAEEFDMTVKNLEKNIPESRISNEYWLGALRFANTYGIDYDKEYENCVKNLKPADIQNILNEILASGIVKTVIMRPDAAAEAE